MILFVGIDNFEKPLWYKTEAAFCVSRLFKNPIMPSDIQEIIEWKALL